MRTLDLAGPEKAGGTFGSHCLLPCSSAWAGGHSQPPEAVGGPFLEGVASGRCPGRAPCLEIACQRPASRPTAPPRFTAPSPAPPPTSPPPAASPFGSGRLLEGKAIQHMKESRPGKVPVKLVGRGGGEREKLQKERGRNEGTGWGGRGGGDGGAGGRGRRTPLPLSLEGGSTEDAGPKGRVP